MFSHGEIICFLQTLRHSPTSKWVVSYTKDSRRRREFFRTKKEAFTRKDQILIELENLGNKAFAISDELRLEAVQCAERLAPFKGSLSDTVDLYLAHLEASRKSCTVSELTQDYLASKSRSQKRKRHLDDLKSRLRRFNEHFASADQRIHVYIAIAAFAGLRIAELDKLHWDSVNLESGLIEVTAGNSKTSIRRHVTVQPNLQAWLFQFPDRTGSVKPKNLRRLLDAAWSSLELGRSRSNDFRNSFASYHYAMFGNPEQTAMELGHSDTSMLYKHYRELVTKTEAESYWTVEPAKRSPKQTLNYAQNL